MNIDNTYLDNVKAKLTINDNIIKGYDRKNLSKMV